MGDGDRYSAITGILRRDYPRFQGLTGIGDDPDEVARAIDAIGRLDKSHIPIQGPPGAGKTFIAAHGITEMLARGKWVGVSSHSHKAINNLLDAVETAATDRGLSPAMAVFLAKPTAPGLLPCLDTHPYSWREGWPFGPVFVGPLCPASDRFRRIFLLGAHRGEGRFTQPTAVTQAWPRELSFMPQSGLRRPSCNQQIRPQGCKTILNPGGPNLK